MLPRRGSGTTEPTRLTAGPLALDLLERTATRDGTAIDL